MPRLFIALDPSEAVKDALADLQEGLPEARWVDIDDLHLTLRFIGEVGDGTARDIVDMLDLLDAPAVTVTPRGVGHFERRGRPSALFVAVEASAELVALQGRVERLLRGAGVAPEPRRFTPHITLARFTSAIDAQRVGHWMEAAPPPAIAPFQISEVTLFRSELRPGGPRYTAEHRVALAALPDADSSDWAYEDAETEDSGGDV